VVLTEEQTRVLTGKSTVCPSVKVGASGRPEETPGDPSLTPR